MTAAILGKKVGMTSLFTDKGAKVPVTVIQAGPCTITQIKTMKTDGYSAVQLGFEEIPERKVNKPLAGHFAKVGSKPMRTLKEFRDMNVDFNEGDEITVEQFNIGDKVKVSGTGKGRGFQGVVERHHFKGVGMATHGQKDRQRHGGSVGQSSWPSRILKGVRMPGRMGGKRVTISNIEVMDIVSDQNIIIVKGCLPGPINSLLEIVKR
jgi:large subunit ribosomal protein L3